MIGPSILLVKNNAGWSFDTQAGAEILSAHRHNESRLSGLPGIHGRPA
jgi:hypothetical protein